MERTNTSSPSAKRQKTGNQDQIQRKRQASNNKSILSVIKKNFITLKHPSSGGSRKKSKKSKKTKKTKKTRKH
jgi:hypothetical protein